MDVTINKLLEIIGYLYVENLTLREKINDLEKEEIQDSEPSP